MNIRLLCRSILIISLTASFTGCGGGATKQSATQQSVAVAKLQEISGQVPAGVIEIQGLSAGAFTPSFWQQNTLNWVPDVRVPMLAAQPTGPNQNIYAPWPLEDAHGWRLFYGGWDGTDTPNDRVYSATTTDFLTFENRTMVIDHGAFQHVNNESVQQLPDGSMHMISTICCPNDLDKPAYFSSPDGVTWNGSPEPYSAQLSDIVAISNDPAYDGSDFNGGNVLLRDNDAWTLYYSGNAEVSIATTSSPPDFQRTGVALSTPNFLAGTPSWANDVKKFQIAGKNWYLMTLYVNLNVPNPPVLSYCLSNDGIQFGPEQELFAGAFPQDQFVITPAFVTKGNQILGVLYGADSTSLIQAQNAIFARWLQRKLLITDNTGAQVAVQGAYGPDRQWIQAPASGSITGNFAVYAEDGVTPLGKGTATLTAGQAYVLVLN